MEYGPPPFEKMLFVCTHMRDANDRAACADLGGPRLLVKLRAALRDRQLEERVGVFPCGCIDVCEEGPHVLLFPDNVWYTQVSDRDLKFIVKDVLKGL